MATALVAGLLLVRTSLPASPGECEASDAVPTYRTPSHVCASPDGLFAYAVNTGSGSVSVLDVRTRKVVAEIAVDLAPVTAAISADGRTLYVACRYAHAVDVVDLPARRVVRSIATGLEPYGVALSRDGRTLYVANSLSDTLSILDVASGGARAEVPVGREPRFVVETPDGQRVVVGNALGRSVTIVEVASGRVLETRALGRASLLRQTAISADGRWAFVAHVLSHDEVMALQIERGWIHSNGFSLLDLSRPGQRVTLLLDRLLAGAANPWGAALSRDGTKLYVSLAGVHEIAIVDVPAALRLVEAVGPEDVKPIEENVEILERLGIARRTSAGGIGPRGIAVSWATGEILVPNAFSDTVTVLDGERGEVRATIALGAPQEMTEWRKGEMLFNDARIAYQSWFSCASCHEEDATVDGLNWDLSNDGLGNPKNVKSLHDVHDTPPAMWTRVREEMDAAVAAGQRFLGLFPVSENHRALMAFLGAPPRAPNPFRGRDPVAEKRGEGVFAKAGCPLCHPAPLFTDLLEHDVGFGGDDLHAEFDTPSLRECYRTAPYLHDGRARTLEDTYMSHNPEERHGLTKGLSEEELSDLVTYLRTL